MKAIITHYNAGKLDNAIYLDVYEYKTTIGIRTPISPIDWLIDKRDIIDYIPLTVKGKTYAERKADLIDKAIMWHHAGSVANWSYSELMLIEEFFETQGRRYGLIREFRENAII
jgi:hypothetical protein